MNLARAALGATLILTAVLATGCSGSSSPASTARSTTTKPPKPPVVHTVKPGNGFQIHDTVSTYRGHTLHCIGINTVLNGDSPAVTVSCDWTRFYDENPTLLRHASKATP